MSERVGSSSKGESEREMGKGGQELIGKGLYGWLCQNLWGRGKGEKE